MDLRSKVGSLELPNPVMCASGTFGYGLEAVEIAPPEMLGAVVVKGLSLNPRAGAPAPRIAEHGKCALLNAIGLENVGVEKFASDYLPALRSRGARVVVNVFGERLSDYVAVIERLEREEGVVAYELNVSCPNVDAGGAHVVSDMALLRELVASCVKASLKPIWVKLPPTDPDPVDTAGICAEAGADAVTLTNTLPAMLIDVERRRPRLGRVTGGMSGPALFPVALRAVWRVSLAHPGLSIVGVGGVSGPREALAYFLAGASAVQVGTAALVDPGVFRRVLDGISDYCRRHGFESVRELVGSLEVSGG